MRLSYRLAKPRPPPGAGTGLPCSRGVPLNGETWKCNGDGRGRWWLVREIPVLLERYHVAST